MYKYLNVLLIIYQDSDDDMNDSDVNLDEDDSENEK